MNGSKRTIGGLISNIKVITTGSGQQMAYLTIEDFVGSVEVIMFARNYQKYKRLFDTTNKVFVTGRIQADADKPARLTADSVVSFDSVPRRL